MISYVAPRPGYPLNRQTHQGKTIFRCDRSTRGGGVCIYVKSDLSNYCKIDSKSTYISPDLEIITIYYTKQGSKFMKISCVYRPPRGIHKNCIDKITEILPRKENFKKELWFMGDFNVDYLKRSDPNFKKFQTMFKTFGLCQLIHDVTRPGISSGSCIDWIITNCRFVQKAYVSNIFISDHFVIECIRKKSHEKKTIVFKTLRDYKNYNKQHLIDLLRQKIKIDTFDEVEDPNVMWETFYGGVIEILSIMCPYKRYAQRENPSPWINADIYRAMRYRDRLIALHRVTYKRLYLTLSRQQRNIVNSMVESAKRLYITTLLNKNSSCPKKFWRHINHLLKGDKSSSYPANFTDQITNDNVPSDQIPAFLKIIFVISLHDLVLTPLMM